MSNRICICNDHMADSDPRRINFYHDHFIPKGWALRYQTLSPSPNWRTPLTLTGYCGTCHGPLEEDIPLTEGLTGDSLFQEIYNAMQNAHPYDKKREREGHSPIYYGRCDFRSSWYCYRDGLTVFARNKQFLDLFHDYDRLQARRWLVANRPTQAHEDVLRDTSGELFCAVVQLAKENGDFSSAEAILDYILPSKEKSGVGEGIELSSYEFDFVPMINFGGSEGIYVDCYLKGRFDESNRSSLRVGTLKTLENSLQASKIMGELCGALMYHASRYVNQNLHRYTPERELLAETENRQRGEITE